MIRYDLICTQSHQFKGWFRDSAAFDEQKSRGLLSCPECGSEEVSKALMAPALVSGKRVSASQTTVSHGAPDDLLEKLKTLRDDILSQSEDVGERFSEEARAMHYEEKEKRSIHGTAASEDIKALDDEGIRVLALPTLPEDYH